MKPQEYGVGTLLPETNMDSTDLDNECMQPFNAFNLGEKDLINLDKSKGTLTREGSPMTKRNALNTPHSK